MQHSTATISCLLIPSIIGKCQWFQALLSLLQAPARQAVLLHFDRKPGPQNMLFALRGNGCVVQVLGKGHG